MRPVIIALICMLTAKTVHAEEQLFTIQIAVPHSVARAGTDIQLNVTFTNISDIDRLLVTNETPFLEYRDGGRTYIPKGRGMVEAANDIIVLREDGTPAPKTEMGKRFDNTLDMHLREHPKLFSGVGTATITIGMAKLSSGSEFDDSTMLNHLYDMSEPGTYTVQVEHVVRPLEQEPVPVWPPTMPPDIPPTGDVIKSNIITLTVTTNNNMPLQSR